MSAALLSLRGQRLLVTAALLCTLPEAAPLHAAQPYVTDDARLVPAGACQLEFGKRVLRGSHEVWLLPACNPGGNLELTVGANRTNPADVDQATDIVLQGKGLFRETRPNDYGLGWVANLEAHRHLQAGQTRVGNLLASGIYSRAFFDEVFFVHANLGVRRLRDERATAATWALAAELNLNDRIALIAETADTTRSRRGYQAGLWVALVPDHFELDVSVGGEARDFRQSRYWAVGLRFITGAFLK